jgi:HSP20 family protein
MAEKATVPVKKGEVALRARDPLDLFEELQQELGRFWGQMGPVFPRPWFRPFGRIPDASTWAPRVDAFEKNGNLVIKAELPGVKKEDVAVTIEDGDLIVSGERKSESEVKEEDYYRMERTFGSFHRRLPIPFEVKADDVKASFTDGVLEVIVPKPKETKPAPQKIAVK